MEAIKRRDVPMSKFVLIDMGDRGRGLPIMYSQHKGNIDLLAIFCLLTYTTSCYTLV